VPITKPAKKKNQKQNTTQNNTNTQEQKGHKQAINIPTLRNYV
jgi:hypothetical protein